MEDDWGRLAWTHLSQLRQTNPLIQCITNFVSMDIMANTLLSSGASPAMVHSLEEIPEFTPKASALLINIGTLSPDWLPSMAAAVRVAREAGVPWVLDPVAAGATEVKMRVCLEMVGMGPVVVRGNGSEVLALANASADQTKILFWILSIVAVSGAAKDAGVLDPVADRATEIRIRVCLEMVGMGATVVKGNGSEVMALANASADQTKGVDSSHESSDAIEAAKSLAKSCGCVVAVSGSVDYVTDGQRVVGVQNGVPMMQKITATGCSVTALIAAFVAVVDASHAFEATASALAVFGLAGELGMEQAKGPASLRTHLIDSLYGLDEDTVVRRVNIVRLL